MRMKYRKIRRPNGNKTHPMILPIRLPQKNKADTWTGRRLIQKRARLYPLFPTTNTRTYTIKRQVMRKAVNDTNWAG